MKFNLFSKKETSNEPKKEENFRVNYKKAVSSVRKDTPVFVISFDCFNKHICILNMIGNDFSTVNIQKIPFKTRVFDDEFYEKLETILNKYLEDKPSIDAVAVYVLIPNECVSNDLISVPSVSKKQMKDSLDITLKSSYKNLKELIMKSFMVYSNKQYATYYILSVKKELIARISTVLASCKLYSKYSTYVSNALLDAVFNLKPKNKNHSFIFLDIKSDCTYFAISNKGRTIGSYYLQYGYKILESNKLVYENMLSNHDLAEITVLNAKEKAKAKQLTTLSDETEKEEGENSADAQVSSDNAQKVLGKKVPKKLPKFMQREVPDTDEAIAFENFRIFMKWALLVKSSYEKKGDGFGIDYFLVNMPNKFNYLLKMANEDMGLTDAFVAFNEDINISDELKENLELYGAIYINSNNKNQVF